MKLRYIGMQVKAFKNETEFYSDFSYKFDFNVRFIDNYLSKAVRKLKIETSNIKMIGITLHPKEEGCKMIAENVLEVCLHYTKADMQQLLQLSDLNARFEYYLHLHEKAYMLAVKAGYSEINIVKLMHIHYLFRANNYKNEWIWKKKAIKEFNIYIIFRCYFTTFDFKLVLEVYNKKKDNLIIKGTVLKTLPDEICFSYKFKNIEIKDGIIIIYGFLDNPMFHINIKDLIIGHFNCKYVYEEEKIADFSYAQTYEKDLNRIKW